MGRMFAPTYANLNIEYHETKVSLLFPRVTLKPVNVLRIPGSYFKSTVKYY